MDEPTLHDPKIVVTQNNINKFSKRLQKSLTRHNLKLPLNEIQEIMAHTLGNKSYHELHENLKKENIIGQSRATLKTIKQEDDNTSKIDNLYFMLFETEKLLSPIIMEEIEQLYQDQKYLISSLQNKLITLQKMSENCNQLTLLHIILNIKKKLDTLSMTPSQEYLNQNAIDILKKEYGLFKTSLHDFQKQNLSSKQSINYLKNTININDWNTLFDLMHDNNDIEGASIYTNRKVLIENKGITEEASQHIVELPEQSFLMSILHPGDFAFPDYLNRQCVNNGLYSHTTKRSCIVQKQDKPDLLETHTETSYFTYYMEKSPSSTNKQHYVIHIKHLKNTLMQTPAYGLEMNITSPYFKDYNLAVVIGKSEKETNQQVTYLLNQFLEPKFNQKVNVYDYALHSFSLNSKFLAYSYFQTSLIPQNLPGYEAIYNHARQGKIDFIVVNFPEDISMHDMEANFGCVARILRLGFKVVFSFTNQSEHAVDNILASIKLLLLTEKLSCIYWNFDNSKQPLSQIGWYDSKNVSDKKEHGIKIDFKNDFFVYKTKTS